MDKPRNLGVKAAALTVIGGAALMAGGSALAAPQDGGTAKPAAGKPREAHVTGDAWVRFSIDPRNPNRRFIFDAHGAPYKVKDGKVYFNGSGRGTVKYFHPESHGSSKGMWGTVDVDYVMTGGPVAVVSGMAVAGPTKGTRQTFSVYSDPRGHRYDRMGFSWGVVNHECTQPDAAPAPFNSYVSGRGYTVRHAELPAIPENLGEGDVIVPPAGCPNKPPA